MQKSMIFLIFYCFRNKNNAKGNDIIDILMFLETKNMLKVMIFLIFCCFWFKNIAKGNEILYVLSF